MDILYEMAFNIDLDFHDVNFNIKTKKGLIHQKQMNYILFLTKCRFFVFPLSSYPQGINLIS